jgi:adenine-specific DNA methylase
MDAAQLPDRSLLEMGDLPFGQLVSFAAREGRRPRPIYQIHKWFARRLGCSFRALLVGAIQPRTANFWEAYYETATLAGVTVLDPFVGGGTSVVEAARLGASAIGVDVDPIACAVAAAELGAAGLEDLEPELRELQASVGKELAPFHATRGPDGDHLTVLHHFWVQVVECPHCGKEGEAHPNYVLAEQAGLPRWVFCSTCHEVQTLARREKKLDCRGCREETRLDRSPVVSGVYTCRHCGHSARLIELGRKVAAPPRWRLFAVEACSRTTGRAVPLKERIFLRATPADRRAFARASERLQEELQGDPDFLPSHAIAATGRSDGRLTAYGYRRWSDLFNDRQLLHLGLLARAIKRVPEESTRRALGLALSSHLTTNCMMTAYAAGWRRLTPLFSIRAFRHIPRPIEVNPWSQGTGRGTYPNAVRQAMRASAFAKSPKEPARGGGFREVPAVTPTKAPRVFNGSASELTFVASGSVDLVLTDPPYFDNVAYSELSEFLQPWLEHLELVPNAAARKRLVRRALRARRANDESLEEFASQLGAAFGEVRRVLKPAGLLAFTFRHSTSDGWLAMAKALARSELRPVQVLPIPGEAGAGLHLHEGTSLWDAVLVFRKLPAPPATELLTEKQIDRARANAQAWRERLRRQERLRFNNADFANLFRASLVAASLGLYGRATKPAHAIRSALDDASETQR